MFRSRMTLAECIDFSLTVQGYNERRETRLRGWKAAGVSHTMVGWTFRLQPHRTKGFKISPDPQLVEKIRDVVGL